MIKNKTVNKTYLKALPPVSKPAQYPSLAQVTAAEAVVAQQWAVVAVLEQSAPLGPAARSRRGTLRGPWVGILPFALYVLLFLGLPLYEVLYGAITTSGGSLTWYNFNQTFQRALLPRDFISSLKISLETAAIGGFFGTLARLRGRHLLARAARCGGSSAAARPCSPTSPACRSPSRSSRRSGRFGELDEDPPAHRDRPQQHELHDQLADRRRAGLRLLPGAADGAARHAGARGPARRNGARPRPASAPRRSRYIRHVAAPVLAPAVIGAVLLLFGNAFAAYATAYALVGDTVQLVPGTIQNLMSGNVLVDENRHRPRAGRRDDRRDRASSWSATALLQRRAGRWLQMRLRLPRRRPRLWRVTILVLAALYFLGPLAASVRFSLVQTNGKDGLRQLHAGPPRRGARQLAADLARDRRPDDGDPARADAADRRVGAPAAAAPGAARRDASACCRS